MKNFIVIFINIIALATLTNAQQLMSDGSYDSFDDIFDLNMEELMDLDINTGKPGWFGNQLEQITFEPYLHGYAVVDYRDFDLNRNRSLDTFDMHYFNVIAGTNISDIIAAEVLLEYEHGGDDINIRYGIIDYKIADPLIIRFGKFLVPMGRFNEYYSPEYANKLPDRPYNLWKIVPIVWAETGIQLRGEYELKSKRSVNYAFYVVNGLEQDSGEGGDIRSMRNNNRDSNNSDKAFGGRIGVKPFIDKDLEIGYSFYTGAYTTDGKQNLTIMDVDTEYKKDKLTLKGEYAWADQEATTGDLKKNGFYAEASYRINSYLEPVIRYDQTDLDNSSMHDIKRSTVGLVYYPKPNLYPMFNFKISQSFVHDDGFGETKHEFVAQCVIGF